MRKSKKKLQADIGVFIQKYKRKWSSAFPNDRDYDRKVEEKIKRMKPEELYSLICDDESEVD